MTRVLSATLVLYVGLSSSDSAALQTPARGETCGVVEKVVSGCAPELQVKAPAQSFKIQIPASARQSFPAILSSYDAATVCVTATAKPGKSFTFKATNPGMIRIANARPESNVPNAHEPMAPGLTAPQLRSQVAPKYTSAAMKAKIQGDVELTVVVMPDGTVADVRVVRSLDPCGGLDEEAIKAAKLWRFTPGQMDGHPVPVRVTLILSFRLHS